MSIPASIGGRATSHDEDRDEVEDALTPEFRKLLATVTREEVDRQPTRCPHAETAERMTKVGCSWVTSWVIYFRWLTPHPLLPPTRKKRILRAKEAHDSIGGTITCVIRNVPPGLGEPVFDKFEAMLAHAMLSIPATKAFEIGSGFRGTEVPGSKHNDKFVKRPDGRLGTSTNWSGGVQGGITNGEDIYFRWVV